MNITVFGADGQIGALVARRALCLGHPVRALVRRDAAVDQDAPFRVVRGRSVIATLCNAWSRAPTR